ncbi:Ig-like domain-containing protein [Haloactinopolyspora alba]|uniref:Ig-like domain-containing protein n=1 Tax=Haloactinopolyspora alba TaxID=648780 RepID=UPI000D0CD896|nr:Ig-like domain-containing protein [Haloactinopolyspora alba]
MASAVAGGGAIASSTAAHADENDLSVAVQEFAAADFTELASDLPGALREAIERDLGLEPAQYLANAEAARNAADVATALRENGVDVLGTSIDGQDVTINVESEDDVAAAEATGANVVVGLLGLLESEREVQPAADHKGGYGYAYQTGEPNDQGQVPLGRCSVAFSGYDPEGNDRFLTAGHCGTDSTTGEQYTYPVHHLDLNEPIWGTEAWTESFPGPELGEFVPGSMNYGGQHDGGLVDITAPDWTGVPQVAGWAGGSGAPDEGSVDVLGTIAPVAGAQACKSGATSGWTCGEILVPEQSVPVGEQDVTGFVFNACMLGGDSGGSIVVGSYALGVNSGSTHEQRTECDTWDPATGPDDTTGDYSIGYAVAGGQYNANDLFADQWELAVSINTPEVTSPGEGAETGPTPTFTGTVQGGRTTHLARLVIDGEKSYQAKVTNDGTFAVKVPDALQPGEHTYELRVTYRQYSTSETVTGTFTSTEAQIEQLAVSSPTDGQVTGTARPDFTGTGHPGATVVLSAGGNELGEATVGDDGSWTITPSADLPVGERFDAVVTQRFEGDSQQVTVADLGIREPAVTITAPEDGATVAGDVVFTGTAHPGATVELQIEGTVTESAGAETAAEQWKGDLQIDEDGAWTFTPAEPLEDGEYTLTASATREGGDPELVESEDTASFTVASDDGGAAGGDEDGEELPDTGSSNTWMIFVGIGLLVAGGAAVAIRARRNSTTTSA